jgi:hypothetical protein
MKIRTIFCLLFLVFQLTVLSGQTHRKEVNALTISDDGKTLYTADNSIMKTWRIPDVKQIQRADCYRAYKLHKTENNIFMHQGFHYNTYKYTSGEGDGWTETTIPGWLIGCDKENKHYVYYSQEDRKHSFGIADIQTGVIDWNLTVGSFNKLGCDEVAPIQGPDNTILFRYYDRKYIYHLGILKIGEKKAVEIDVPPSTEKFDFTLSMDQNYLAVDNCLYKHHGESSWEKAGSIPEGHIIIAIGASKLYAYSKKDQLLYEYSMPQLTEKRKIEQKGLSENFLFSKDLSYFFEAVNNIVYMLNLETTERIIVEDLDAELRAIDAMPENIYQKVRYLELDYYKKGYEVVNSGSAVFRNGYSYTYVDFEMKEYWGIKVAIIFSTTTAITMTYKEMGEAEKKKKFTAADPDLDFSYGDFYIDGEVKGNWYFKFRAVDDSYDGKVQLLFLVPKE